MATLQALKNMCVPVFIRHRVWVCRNLCMSKTLLVSAILESNCSFPLSNHFCTTVSKAKSALALELKLYQKIIYKNNNSHKNTKYWQRIRQVKSWIQSLQLALEYFSQQAKPHDTSIRSSILVLHKLYALFKLCTEVGYFSLHFLTRS